MKRVQYSSYFTQYFFIAPQLAIILIFLYLPIVQTFTDAFTIQDAFGFGRYFAGFDNFIFVLSDPNYVTALKFTLIFIVVITFFSCSIGLLLAVQANNVIHGKSAYKTLLIWPYAIAPAIAGVLWLFLFNGNIGLISYYLQGIGYEWNHTLDGDQAMFLVILASSWGRISYNFLFFLAGLQAIPKSIIEAAAIDGASFWRRFLTIVIPLLSPITFFLLVVNIVYAFFDTFGIVHTITSGGPEQDTNILVYKVFSDGFVSQDLGSSAAQSVILLVLVGILTIIQFKYIEKKVHY